MAIYSSAAAEKSAVVSATPARLSKVGAINSNAAVRYLMVLDAASLPANGAVPKWRIPVAATTGYVEVDFGANGLESEVAGLDLTTGCVLAFSTTSATLTIITVADDALFTAVYSD